VGGGKKGKFREGKERDLADETTFFGVEGKGKGNWRRPTTRLFPFERRGGGKQPPLKKRRGNPRLRASLAQGEKRILFRTAAISRIEGKKDSVLWIIIYHAERGGGGKGGRFRVKGGGKAEIIFLVCGEWRNEEKEIIPA